MIDTHTVSPIGRTHLPPQAQPVNRSQPSAAQGTVGGVEADLFGLPIGDILDSASGVLWPMAKDFLNA